MKLLDAFPYFIVSPTHVHCVDLSWRLRGVFYGPSNWPGIAFPEEVMGSRLVTF